MKKQHRHAQAKRMKKPAKEHKKSKWRQMVARYVAL